MITDEALERGLTTAAQGYDVPERGVRDLLDLLAPPPRAAIAASDPGDRGAARGRWRRATSGRRGWYVGAAAGAVLLVALALAVGGGGGRGGSADQGGAAALGAPANGAAKTAGHAPMTPRSQEAGSSVAGLGAFTAGARSAAGAAAAAPPGAVPQPIPPQTAPQTATQGAAQGGLRTTVGSSTPGSAPAPDALSKVVKTGEVDLQVDKSKVKPTVTALGRLVDAVGGYISDKQMAEGSDASATVTMRIPSASFDAAMARASALGKVLSSQSRGVNVTAQYVDLQARLHALSATRAVYLRLLSKATTIGEILSVQQQVNDVQTQIEQLQGQLKVLNDQTSYGTLTVQVDQKAAPAPVAQHQSGLSKAVHRSVARFVHGVEAIIAAIGPILLVLLVLAVGYLAARAGYRLVRRQLV